MSVLRSSEGNSFKCVLFHAVGDEEVAVEKVLKFHGGFSFQK